MPARQHRHPAACDEAIEAGARAIHLFAGLSADEPVDDTERQEARVVIEQALPALYQQFATILLDPETFRRARDEFARHDNASDAQIAAALETDDWDGWRLRRSLETAVSAVADRLL